MGCPSRCFVAFALFLGGSSLACFQDEGPGGADGASGGGSADPCASYAAKVISCEFNTSASESDVQTQCDAALEMTVGACRDAYVDVLACYVTEDCNALVGGQGCQAEASALPTACGMSTNSTCTAYGQKTAACGVAGQDAAVCQAGLDAAAALGAWCEAATTDLYACRAELACSELAGGSGCEAEAQTVMSACD